METLLKAFSATLLIIFNVSTSHCKHNEDNDTIGFRIIGGSVAPKNNSPYMASLRDTTNFHFCSGSIIGSSTILTAAHCIFNEETYSFFVVLGTQKLNSGGEKYTVSYIKHHEDYNHAIKANDIGLIKLSRPIQYKETIQPIKLEEYNIVGIFDVELSGWGLTSYPRGNPSNDLYYIKLKTMSLPDCQEEYRKIEVPIQESQICTFTKYGEGSCRGDSGGPLVLDNKQIGIVSMGNPCAVGYPDVFTRISFYLDWIRENDK